MHLARLGVVPEVWSSETRRPNSDPGRRDHWKPLGKRGYTTVWTLSSHLPYPVDNQACVLHHFGFRNVAISELSEKRRKIAERLGTGFKVMSVEETAAAMPKDQESVQDVINKCLNSQKRPNLSQQDDAQLNGIGVLLDCSGSPAALSNAFKWTKRGAMVCVFGCPPVNRPMR